MKTISTFEIKNRSSERGIGLVPAIIIISIFTSLILIMARYSWTNSHRNALEALNEKAYYLSQSGIEFALKKSLDNNNWNWNQSGKYGGGEVNVSVLPQGVDTILIQSYCKVHNTAKQNSLLLYMINLMNYSIYVSGSRDGNIGCDSENYLRFNQSQLPLMNLDSLKQIAKAQGRYYTNNQIINNGSPAFGFWSNPGDHAKDANIVYAEKNLTINKTNADIGGIFVVMGNFTMSGKGEINGIIYMANSLSTKLVQCSGGKTTRTIYGAIIGNTDVKSRGGPFNPEITVYYNSTFLEKFYNYSVNQNPSVINKLSWISDY
jgi:hypothetical protein